MPFLSLRLLGSSDQSLRHPDNARVARLGGDRDELRCGNPADRVGLATRPLEDARQQSDDRRGGLILDIGRCGLAVVVPVAGIVVALFLGL